MSYLLPVKGATITQRWGYTGLASNGPYRDNKTGLYYASGFHTGLDMSAPNGTHVHNVQHGIVYAASWEGCEPDGGCWGYGGGYVVIVKHNSHPVWSSHAHMQAVYVKPGQPVYRGQPLGELDTRGMATGPHDHFSIWVRGLWYTVNGGYTIDPMSAHSGKLANASWLRPAACRVPLDVHLRSGPGRGYPIVLPNRKATVLPMFKEVEGGAVAGHTSRRWRLVYHGRWAWVYKPFSQTVRTYAIEEEEVEPVPVYEGTERGVSLTDHAPGADESLHQEDPGDGIRESRSSVLEYADAEDAF